MKGWFGLGMATLVRGTGMEFVPRGYDFSQEGSLLHVSGWLTLTLTLILTRNLQGNGEVLKQLLKMNIIFYLTLKYPDSVSDNIRQSGSVEIETVFTIPSVENSDSHRNKCKSCKKCIVCCYYVLQKFNLHSLASSNLFLAYKFVLTSCSSQVACERSFSKLKYSLNRLRNLLSQSSLQSFMLMFYEKDLLPRINNNEIID